MADDDGETSGDEQDSAYHLGMCPERCSAVIADGQACGEYCKHYVHLTGDHQCQGEVSHTF